MKYLFVYLITFNAFGAITLKEAFESAKNNMETLRRSGAQIKQALERKNQARASLMPSLSGVGNETRIDPPQRRPGVSSPFLLTRQYSAALRLQQPLLRGGIFAGLQGRTEEVLLAEFQKNASEIGLYQLVITAYYNLMAAQLDLKNFSKLLNYSKDRVKELRSFVGLGRSRKAELIQAETQLLNAEAQYKQAEMNLTEARGSFEFYTGLQEQDLAPLSVAPKELPDLSEYMDKLKQRPDVLARRQEVKVAEQRIEVTKGGHYPNVDLVSNYYFDRTGVLQTSEWDVAVVVNLPLFQGGSVVAQTREAVEGKRIAELNSDETIRAARRDLAVLYQNYHQMQTQLETMKEALKKSEEAYNLNLKDYRHGLVTNLEVLQGLNLFIETKRSFDSLTTQAYMTFKNIEASTGVLP